MVNGIRASKPRGLNNGRGWKFSVDSRVPQETPEEAWRTHRPKRSKYNYKDEDNNPKTVNDKNHQASSQKFWQLHFSLLILMMICILYFLLEFYLLKYCFSIIMGFRTIVFIFIVISTTFRPICPQAFTELRTTSFIESTGVACSDSISHNWVQVLSIPVLLLACSQDWTCNLQMIVSLEA